MTNLLFLGCLYAESQKDFFLKSSKRGYQSAAQNFQEALVDGFLNNIDTNTTILSIPSLSAYPKGCNLFKVDSASFLNENKEVGKAFGYINIPFLKGFHNSKIDKYIDKWYSQAAGSKVIVVYALLRNQLQYAVAAKKRHSDIKLCVIVPDLPMYMRCNKYYKMLGLQKKDMEAIDKLVHQFDSYVVLAEPMVEQLRVREKPYVVIEGIYRAGDEMQLSREIPLYKTLLYAGGIQTRYGVFDLIEAFHRLPNKDYRLVLCGSCQEMRKLNSYLSADKRIEYLGLIPTDKVRKLQKKVTLLVNPRHSSEDFTKYSFPSKTLEYMASGTPVLMSPLSSMPNDYKKNLFLFNDESVEGMMAKIEEVLNLDATILDQIGKSASDFILSRKNTKAQVAKIIDLINK